MSEDFSEPGIRKYPDVTLDQIKEAIDEYFGKEVLSLTYAELRERVLSGYTYKIDSPGLTAHTGKGGVLLCLDKCEKAGVPAGMIAKSIICYTDMGPYPLSS